MLTLTMGAGALWTGREGLDRLSSFCAELIRAKELAGCLAPLPKERDQRQRLFSFMASLKTATGGRMLALLYGAELTEADLIDCETSPVDSVLIVQRSEDPTPAIDSLLAFHKSHPDSTMGFGVWVDPSSPGDLHRTEVEWRRRAGWPLEVGLAPLSLDVSANGNVPKRAAGQPLTCEWLRGTVTVHPTGVVIPCPQHSLSSGVPLDGTPADIVAEIGAWPRVLGSHPVCRSCTRQMRFTIPEWMKSRERFSDEAGVAGGQPYEDHAGRSLDVLDATQQERIIADFLERVRRSGGSGNGPEAT